MNDQQVAHDCNLNFKNENEDNFNCFSGHILNSEQNTTVFDKGEKRCYLETTKENR